MFMEELKHEVMVNFLFQLQCTALWIGDGSGMSEGVLLRKSRGCYLSCPHLLAESPLGEACAALNVQVSNLEKVQYLAVLLTELGCHDC
jgi:hypothetical protein